MGLPRIIPTLLVKNNYFYKGEKFKITNIRRSNKYN